MYASIATVCLGGSRREKRPVITHAGFEDRDRRRASGRVASQYNTADNQA